MSDEVYDLPEGWTWTTIGEACHVNPPMKFPERLTGDTPVHFVPMAAVDDVTGAIVAPEPRPIEQVWKGYKRFQNGDVIFARITPCMENGKAAIATGLLNGIGLGSTEFHVLRPKERVGSEWIYYFVRQQSFRNKAARAMTGTAGQLRVPADFIAQAPIPLPSLAEQQRIIAKVASLSAQSGTVCDALERMPTLLKRFRQSVLASAFRGDLTERDANDEPAMALLERIRAERRAKREAHVRAEGRDPNRATYEEVVQTDTSNLPRLPDEWTWTVVGEVIDTLQYGTSVRADADAKAGIPVLRMGNIQDGRLDFAQLKFIQPGKEDIKKYLLEEGDILINRTNSPELVGKAALFDGEGRFLFASYLIRLRVDPHITLPRYLTSLIDSDIGRRHVANVKHQVAGQANINSRDIRSMPFPLAPMAEQHRIVAKIESLFAQADAIERAVAIARPRANKIDQAILARAFRGEL